MTPGFGARLRAQREQQQIALATIAEQTKIKASLLEGLERDDLSYWPGGVFRRSYIRAYASAIGLEPEAVLREFQESFPEPTDALPEVVAVAQRATGETVRMRPPTRLRFLIGSALEALPALKTQLQTSVGLGPKTPARAAAHVDASPADQAADLTLEQTVGSSARVPLELEPEPGAAMLFELTPPRVFAQPALDAANDEPLDAIALGDVADLCTRMAVASEPRQLQCLLTDAAQLLDAVGVTLWMWDAESGLLHPAMTHGYAPDVAAQLPSLSSDSDNAVGAAFRAAATRIVDGTLVDTGAVVVPLKIASGCAGVLAFELRDGGERRACVRACVEIFAAQLSRMVGYTPLMHAATA